MNRSLRVPIAAVVLLLAAGSLCAAWYVSSQRALAAEQREREQRAMRATAEREQSIAASLAKRLEELRRDESQRPYFHYQNLYHDPKGASEGLSVVPSPLANGSGHPLIAAHFQIDARTQVTLPTLNEELQELSAPNAREQMAVRDAIGAAATGVRAAAAPLVRIATLEARAAQRPRATTPAAPPTLVARLEARPAPRSSSPPPPAAAEVMKQPQVKAQVLSQSAFQQNMASNDVYREVQQNRGRSSADRRNVERNNVDLVPVETSTVAPAPVQPANVEPAHEERADVADVNPVRPDVAQTSARRNDEQIEVAAAPPPEPPVEIRMTDLEWKTLPVAGAPRLIALRGVNTPVGALVQGVLTPFSDGSVIDGAKVRFGSPRGSVIEGTGWRVVLDPAEALAAIRRDQVNASDRFARTFAVVAGLLLLGVSGVVWMLARSESLAIQKTRFAATAAHELRTPLASLRLYSEMIADERDPGKRERYAREIAGQTERLGRVVANVLEITRIERGTFALRRERGEIGRAVEDCISKLRPQLEAAGCPVDLSVAPDLPRVAFDADALHHIVDNLVDNAEKYSRDRPERDVAVAVAPDEGGVTITVSDRGPGLPDAFVRDPRPFRRGGGDAPEGLGIGLFLVDRIVRGHGGALRAIARPGGGTTVRVFLPA